jgi:NodT family efflux transporter outer membrane factor (OMF) lipoprotein
MSRWHHLAFVGTTAPALLVGCNVGPRYVRPPAPEPDTYKEASPTAYSDMPAGTWQPARPQDGALKGHWWELFNEPELDSLEQQLNINNQNIAQYFQNYMAARAQVSEVRAQYFPTVTTTPAYTTAHAGATAAQVAVGGAAANAASGASSGSGSSGTTGSSSSSGENLREISLPLDASWAPDLWGRVRNTVREYRSAAQVSAADLENERLTEQASLAEYYFELRGQDALQALYDSTIRADSQSLALTQSLAETGIESEEDVAEAQVTLENAEATGVGIATNRALYEHAIATLTGQPASTFSMPVRSLSTPVPAIPIGVPSELLQRRPDIAAAERTMAEANALIGVETAAYYPTLSLTGTTGFQSSVLSKLFAVPAFFWSLGASASETIFEGGLRHATVAQYTANYRADVAAYRETVLTGFQQVEDYVATLRVTSNQIARQDAAVAAARHYLALALDRYQTGLDPYLDVITAQTTLLSDQQTDVTLRVNEMMAAVELIQALGGGWDVSQLQLSATATSAPASDSSSMTRP